VALVSIVVPTFNRPDLLHRALSSIAAQTMTDFEIVVVNDGGSDPTPVIAKTASNLPPGAKIEYVAHSFRKGLPAARNTAVAASSGQYIAYLDDDDAYLPNHLAVLSDALNRNLADVVYGDYERVVLERSGDGWREHSRTPQQNPEFDPQRIMLENYIPVNCFMHRRECFDECGEFDEWLTGLEDWDLWFRFALSCRFQHIPETTCQVCTAPELKSITSEQKIGFVWPSLNCLYKCRDATAGAPALQVFYEEKAGEALRHIRHHIFRLWEERSPTLTEIFSFHEPKLVYARLGELEDIYGTHPALFKEVRGLILAQASDFEGACRHLREAIALDPSNESAPKVLALLQGAIAAK